MKLKKIIFLLIIFFLFSILVLFSDEIKLNVKEHTLKNGMKILILEKHEAPIFTAFIMFGVGSVCEYSGTTGMCHLLEHMMFKGTKLFGTTDYQKEIPIMNKIEKIADEIEKETAKSLTAYGKYSEEKVKKLREEINKLTEIQRKYIIPNEIDKIYNKNGSPDSNAFTGYDYTGYCASFPSNKLELWALLESDRFKAPVFREFYTERNVVYEERRRSKDAEPDSKLFEEFMASAFQATPYHHLVIGWASDIETYRTYMAKEFFNKYYIPNNCVVAIAGDVKEADVLRLMKKYFENIPAGKLPRPVFTKDAPQKGERRIELVFDARPSLLIGYHGPKLGDLDQYVLDVIDRILSLGRDSRLYKNLVDKKRIARYATSSNDCYKYGSLFVIDAQPKGETTTLELEKAIYEELERLKTEPVSKWELKKVKNQIEISFIRRVESIYGIAKSLCLNYILTGDWRNLDERNKLRAVTPQDITRVAKKYFVKENRTVAILVSKKSETRSQKSQEEK